MYAVTSNQDIFDYEYISKYESGNNIFHHFSEICDHDRWLNQERTIFMSENNTDNRKNNKSSITTGATALISVLAVPVTLLAGLLLSNRKKK